MKLQLNNLYGVADDWLRSKSSIPAVLIFVLCMDGWLFEIWTIKSWTQRIVREGALLMLFRLSHSYIFFYNVVSTRSALKLFVWDNGKISFFVFGRCKSFCYFYNHLCRKLSLKSKNGDFFFYIAYNTMTFSNWLMNLFR